MIYLVVSITSDDEFDKVVTSFIIAINLTEEQFLHEHYFNLSGSNKHTGIQVTLKNIRKAIHNTCTHAFTWKDGHTLSLVYKNNCGTSLWCNITYFVFGVQVILLCVKVLIYFFVSLLFWKSPSSVPFVTTVPSRQWNDQTLYLLLLQAQGRVAYL